MTGIGSGNGGFRQGNQKFTFDIVEEGTEGVGGFPVDTGDLKVDNTKKDIGEKTKRTIGEYLSNSTSKNAFPIDAKQNKTSTSTQNQNPQPLAPSQNSQQFIDSQKIGLPIDIDPNVDGKKIFRNLPDGRSSVNDPSLTLQINKGKSDISTGDGNTLLNNGNNLPNPKVKPYISAVLSNNRFSSAGQSQNNILRHPTLGDFSFGRLAQVGQALSIRASSELGSTKAGNNPTSGGQQARSILPGFNQLGIERIDLGSLETSDVLINLTQEEIPDSNFVSISPGGSWGSLNNTEDPFSGLNALGMIALSTALTISVVALYEGLGFVLSLIKGGGNGNIATKDPQTGRYALGYYHLNSDVEPKGFPLNFLPPDISSMLGIRPTIHPFSTALQAGVAGFFGINTDNGIFGQITSTLKSSTQTPGFNVVVARSIIRSTLGIVDGFKRIFSSSNVISGVENVLAMVDYLKSSKLIGALNVFATLGDQILNDELNGETVPSLPGETRRKSLIDSLPDDVPAVQKSRLNNSSKLAWANNLTPSVYLLPASLQNLSTATELGSFNTGFGLTEKLSKTMYVVQSLAEQMQIGGRIPYDSQNPTDITVKSVESQLESEYVPFYFHDLRTNEIISFHAFLTTLTENFGANWESSEGFGRIDPVQIYKNTQRKISLGFVVVATSENDFSEMWLKLNKLITMIYPQFSQGRLLSDADNNNSFIQPFSQIITASPLIRIRLGDLIKSNYSRFNLARLFGADSGDSFKLNGENLTLDGDPQQFFTDAQKEFNNPVGKKFLLYAPNAPKTTEQGGISISIPLPLISSGDKPKNSPTLSILPSDFPFILGTVIKIDGNKALIKPEIMSAQQISSFYNFSSEVAGAKFNYLKNLYDNSDIPLKKITGTSYEVQMSNLRISPETIKNITSKNLGNSGEDIIQKLSDFMNPKNNAVVNAFQSTGGKGACAIINSIDFDWINQITWETSEPGKKAPKMARITMSLQIIHDITPGLDFAGANRAPVYPIGWQNQGNDKI